MSLVQATIVKKVENAIATNPNWHEKSQLKNNEGQVMQSNIRPPIFLKND